MRRSPFLVLLHGVSAARDSAQQRGQALVLFVLVSVGLIGAVALVTDVSWLWYGQQRMQRAADAASLAGAIFLPGNPTQAYSTARAEATKNGFTNGVSGVTVTPLQDATNNRRLIVTITGNVGTYFARALGFNQFGASATSRAEYVLPVPMGSPQNYYGVGYFVDAVTTTTTTPVTEQTDWHPEATVVSGGSWTNPSNAATNNNAYATASANNATQQWTGFDLQNGHLPNVSPPLVVIGLEVQLADVFLTGSGTSTNCFVRVETSWDGGTSWSTPADTAALNTTTSADRIVGSAATTVAWGAHVWTRDDFANANFRARLTWIDTTATCAATRNVSLDHLIVRVTYTYTTTSSSTTLVPTNITGPAGQALNPQYFWGSMQSQGAPSIQGDAYMTKYEVRTSTANAAYLYDQYYMYGVELAAGSSNGGVWIFDPGHCEVGTSGGTGENWTVGGTNGYATRQPVSTYYDLYDSANTPYDLGDDTLVASSANAFEQLFYSDYEYGQTNANDCQGVSWHNGWYQLASGLSGGGSGKTYRLHTYSTDTGNLNDQNNTTALNSFSIFASASGGTPKVYGIGAMEAYVRLPGGSATEFYMAQIADVHAGKTMVIELWDPGDTGSLSASLQILEPNSSTYAPTTFSYTATQGTTAGAASACNGNSGTNVTSVTTNTGGSSLFNGCWVTITIVIPSNYTAPLPTSDTIAPDGGWWKIRYTMGGSAASFSTDLTTWKVAIRGNPVHLVP